MLGLLMIYSLFFHIYSKLDKAQKLWRDSLKAAERLEMLYDQATAMYKLGKATDVKDSRDMVQEKLRYHDKAIDIFDQLGAVYTELQLE
jgi:flagellin-specific chaperone FliS